MVIRVCDLYYIVLWKIAGLVGVLERGFRMGRGGVGVGGGEGVLDYLFVVAE